MPQCDSSQTCTRAVWPKPSPAVLRQTFTAGISEVSRFVHEVSRRVWGLRLRRAEPELALTLRPMLPSAHFKDVGARIASFRSSIAHPAYPLLSTLRCVPRGSNARLEAERIATPFS